MKEKILVLANNSDGLYGFRNDLLAELVKKGELVTSVPDNGFFFELQNIGCRIIETPIDRRGINPATDFRLFLRYWKILRQEKPELVLTYTIKPNIYGGMACRLLGIPYGANITGLGTAFQKTGALRTLVTMLYRTALKRAKVVFFENADNMAVLRKEKIVTAAQAHLLNGAGVNLEHYALAPYPGEGTTRFLFVGRVMREKGVEELFAAMERLRAEDADCCLDVLGGYEENYAETIRTYEKQGWLHYHGYVQDVRPYIEQAHCFVLPSWHEGMANTNLECAAMGRPLITSNIPGCREAVQEGESGLLCEPKNADSLYQAMEYFLSIPREVRTQMGRAGRRHVENVFDKKKVVAETVKALGL